MIFTYGHTSGNGYHATWLYLETFPYWKLPHQEAVAAVDLDVQSLEQTETDWNISTGYCGLRKTRELLIPLICSWGPRYQNQTIAAVLSVECMTIWSVLHEQLSYPCHLQSVLGLVSSDDPPTVNFCGWFVQQTTSPSFISSVLFTDEVTYGREGITNFHNQHQHAGGNQCGTIYDRHQLQVRISVWAGIVGDCLVGSHISF
jgi:hypothetical protein